jgi:hypothetical protein
MADYIPSSDSELIEFAMNFINRISGNEAELGLTAADTTAITALRSTFNLSYIDNNTTQMSARSTREKKDADREPLVAKLREAAQRIQNSPNVTDAQRAELGLTIRQTSSAPTGAPDSRPVLEIDTSEPLRHTVKFYDNVLETKGKPDGVRGAEIWCKIGGEATMNEDDYRYLGTDTASPYLAIHRPENVGKQAHYIARWVNGRGEYGAWSNSETATITG